MVTREDLESFFIRMDLEYEEVEQGMYLVRGRNSSLPTVVHHTDQLLLIRMKVMDLPEIFGQTRMNILFVVFAADLQTTLGTEIVGG